MALRSTIVFPAGTIAVQMGAPENLALLQANPEPGLLVALVVAGDTEAADPMRLVGKVGVAARVHERINLPGDTVQVTLQGLRRLVIGDIVSAAPYVTAEITPARETAGDAAAAQALVGRIVTAAETLAGMGERVPKDAPQILRMNVGDPGRFADLAAGNLSFRIGDRDAVLQRLDLVERLRVVLDRLEGELEQARVLDDVKRHTEVKIEQHQREFYLRQQLRAIQAELGEHDPGERDAAELLARIEVAALPEEAAREARRETERLRLLSPAASEYHVIRTYLDWVLALPWHARSGSDDIPLAAVEQALDKRHWGLAEAKERILEYLAVRKLRGGDPLGPILCFVGPPGTGKTSLGEAIAEAIGRTFYRISVGGVRDEAEIRGHRRTYVGAMPGLVLQGLRRAGVRDAVLMIDEIDKMTAGGPSGDPTAAMLEVLDPSQNRGFVDHYLNLPFDLSSVLFICTLAFIATRWSREAGLRNFERQVATLMRKRARRKAEGELGAWVLDTGRVETLLGPPRWAADEAEREPEIGAVTGLAWTADGGELLTIEALRMPGTGKLAVTGQLGEVMRESVDAAHSFVRSRAAQLGVEDATFATTDLHVHFPAGAIPKDGPSAGVAVTLAIASVFARRPVRRDVAMTGEVTLRGKVLEVGGIKDKVLAAYRAGLREVLLPKGNEKDLRELPPEVRERMHVTCVATMDDVLAVALLAPAVRDGTADGPADAAPRQGASSATLASGRSDVSTPAGTST